MDEECSVCEEEIDRDFGGCINCANQRFYAALAFFSLACFAVALVLHHYGY